MLKIIKMGKYRTYVMLAAAVIFSVVGILFGYFVFGPVLTSVADGTSYTAQARYPYIHENTTIAGIEEIDVHYQPADDIYSMHGQNLVYPPVIYVVTVQDDFIIVRHVEAVGKVCGPMYMTTNTPVSALPIEEQQRLADGIFIYDEDSLFRILEDFGS